MSNTTYTLKISPQGQVTLPKALREFLNVHMGSRVTITEANNRDVIMSGKYPIEKHFGKFPNLWTKEGEDAAEYIRKMRDEDWQHVLDKQKI